MLTSHTAVLGELVFFFFVGRDEKLALLKTSAWEAKRMLAKYVPDMRNGNLEIRITGDGRIEPAKITLCRLILTYLAHNNNSKS